MREIIFTTLPNINPTPEGIDKLQHRIYYADGIYGYIEEFTGSLTFNGGSYEALRQTLFNGGCSVVPVILIGFDGVQYPASVFLNDAKWFPLMKAVEVEVVPRGYLTNIDNNAGIKIYLNVPRAKDGSTIPAPIVTNLAYVRPNGSAWVNNRAGVRVFDALGTLIRFMTNNEVSFVSDYFSAAGYQPYLIKGIELRTGGGAAEPENGDWFPDIAFADLMEDLYKMFCVIFSSVDGQNVIRIEPKDYFNQQPSGVVVADPNATQISQTTDPKSFFAKMMFGGDFDDQYNFLPQLRFLGFDEEEYFIGGQCNTKSELDLRPRHVIVDTNIIQQVIEWGATSVNETEYDRDIFMIFHDTATGAPLLTQHPVNPSNIYYNKPLSNYEIALRWFGQVPFNVYSFFGFGQNEAGRWRQAEYLPPYVGVSIAGPFATLLHFPLTAPPLGFDPNGNMNDVNGSFLIPDTSVTWTGDVTFYDAPVSAVYTVHADVYWYGPASSFWGLYVAKYDALGNWLNVYPTGVGGFAPSVEFSPDFHRVQGSVVVDAQATDRLCLMFVARLPEPIGYLNVYSSRFWVDDPFTVAQTTDESEVYLMQTELTMPISDSVWQTLRNTPHGEVVIQTTDGVILGQLIEAQRNPTDQAAQLKINSRLKTA